MAKDDRAKGIGTQALGIHTPDGPVGPLFCMLVVLVLNLSVPKKPLEGEDVINLRVCVGVAGP